MSLQYEIEMNHTNGVTFLYLNKLHYTEVERDQPNMAFLIFESRLGLSWSRWALAFSSEPAKGMPAPVEGKGR